MSSHQVAQRLRGQVPPPAQEPGPECFQGGPPAVSVPPHSRILHGASLNKKGVGMKHPIYVKTDIWPIKGHLTWTVLVAQGERKLRIFGLESTKELCEAAIRKQIDQYVAEVSQETPVRFHRTS